MSYSATPSIMSQLAASVFWPGGSARRSQAMSVYLLAVVWDRPNTRARCSGSAPGG